MDVLLLLMELETVKSYEAGTDYEFKFELTVNLQLYVHKINTV